MENNLKSLLYFLFAVGFFFSVGCSKSSKLGLSLIEESQSDEVIFKKHKIRKGESLWSIAIKYGTTITSICEVNKLNRNKPIHPGKTITVPIGIYKDPPKKIYHIVKRGDTLSELAQKYNTSVSKIKKWNGLKNSRIKIGKKLVIHK